jgi:hypothetical protein
LGSNLRGKSSLGDCILFGHELALLGMLVPARLRIVIDAGCGINPDLALFRLSGEICEILSLNRGGRPEKRDDKYR